MTLNERCKQAASALEVCGAFNNLYPEEASTAVALLREIAFGALESANLPAPMPEGVRETLEEALNSHAENRLADSPIYREIKAARSYLSALPSPTTPPVTAEEMVAGATIVTASGLCFGRAFKRETPVTNNPHPRLSPAIISQLEEEPNLEPSRRV